MLLQDKRFTSSGPFLKRLIWALRTAQCLFIKQPMVQQHSLEREVGGSWGKWIEVQILALGTGGPTPSDVEEALITYLYNRSNTFKGCFEDEMTYSHCPDK